MANSLLALHLDRHALSVWLATAQRRFHQARATEAPTIDLLEAAAELRLAELAVAAVLASRVGEA